MARAQLAATEQQAQARMLATILPLLGVLALCSSQVVRAQPGTPPGEVWLFAAVGTLITLAGVAQRLLRTRLPYLPTVVAVMGLLGLLIVERILRLFLTGFFDVPGRSLYMPVYSALPVLYVMCFVLLPRRWAVRTALLLWLPISLCVTFLILPYWGDAARRGSLYAVLAFLWLGHGVYLVLFSATARRQSALTEAYAALAEAEHRARQASAASEARFRSVFDLAAVAINVTDAEGRYLMANRRMADMLGYSVEELMRMTFRDITLPEDVEAGAALAARLASGEVEVLQAEKRYRRKDGQIVHADIFVRELAPEADGQRRFISVAVDITSRKQAEEAAAEHRRIRDFHFDNTPLAVVEWDAELRVRRWSKRTEQLLGWSEAEAVGRLAEDLRMFPPAHLSLRRERCARMFRGELDHTTTVVPLLHRSGKPRWAEVYNSIVRGADGKVRTLVSMALDITESQEMLHMLNESEARFRGIFNQAAVGIALLDSDGRWLNVNQKLCEITGYGLDELLEIDFQSITHPDDLERDLHMARAVMDRVLDHYSMEKRYIRKDGSVIWVMLFVRRLDAADGLPARFVSVVEDISERKAAEARVSALTASLESKVSERTAQLRDIIRAGQRRNEELSLITEMGRMLSAATDLDEAAQVVVRYLPRIFPLADGALYLADKSGERFERHARWGESSLSPAAFTGAQCWGLRRGELHHVESEANSLYCGHVHDDCRTLPHLCMPILSLESPLGLIELSWGRSLEGWAPEMPMVKTVAEKIGLSFGNLRLREELSRQALVDMLTGLNNRRWLESALRMREARHARGGGGFAVLMIDVDHFKSINDGYGHDAGDLALREVGAMLARTVRNGEAAARFGGEEFTVVLDTVEVEQAMAAGERIRAAVTALRLRNKDRDLPPLTVSIGVALFPVDGSDAQAVIERADAALYEVKRNGRNQVRLAAPAREALSGAH